MASNRILSDAGLVRSPFSAITIDGYTYLLKTGSRSKPVRSAYEFGETGLPAASSHAVDFQKLSGEIMAYAGTPEPSQLYPFSYDGAYWTLGNLTLVASTEGLRSYTVELIRLASTLAANITTTA